MKVVVVGGGLAGLAAALELSREGHAVTVVEARPTLGGAVQTLPEREGDPSPPPDNGQHVALGCCTEYVDFLAEIGQSVALRRMRLGLPVVAEDGRVETIRPGLLGLLRYGHVSVRERLAIGRVARRLATLDPAAHDHETFGDLLRRLGQSQVAIDRFWDVFIRPALNLRTDEVSAAPGIFTVQTALLAGGDASDLLLPAAPLGEMHGVAAAAELGRRGVEISLDTRIGSLDELEADAVVLAVPSGESARLLGEDDRRLEDSPIVSAHLLFDRPILRFPLAALLASGAHWLFDRGLLTGHPPERGQYITIVSSGAPELLELRGRALVEELAGQVTERLGRAELLWSRVSREPAATFAARPGTASRRPGAVTGRANVVRAGAWTATGWPATMESAVRSGREAARVLSASVREKVEA
ncbi:MAG TPA: hydroxysqualene dehydroxylase HpnE [Gaiellaceae bacterium]